MLHKSASEIWNKHRSASAFFLHQSCRQLELIATWFFDWLIDDRLYSAILHSLQQTHCACMSFYMSD